MGELSSRNARMLLARASERCGISLACVRARCDILLARASERCELFAIVASTLVCACTPTALETVDLGDQIEAPELSLDEQLFHCEIQPKVLTQYGCAAGGSGDSGGCHAQRSALRLVEAPTPPLCQGGRVIGAPSPESLANLERVRMDIGVDADSSPLYRRPTGLDSHPRVIFTSDSEPATLLRSWLNGGGPP